MNDHKITNLQIYEGLAVVAFLEGCILAILFAYGVFKCSRCCRRAYVGYKRERELDLENGEEIELVDNTTSTLRRDWRAAAARNPHAAAPRPDAEMFDEDDLRDEEVHPHELGNHLESVYTSVEDSR
jgi:hypothetical protein